MELHSRSSVRDRYAAIKPWRCFGMLACMAMLTLRIKAPEAVTCISQLSPMFLNCSMQLTLVYPRSTFFFRIRRTAPENESHGLNKGRPDDAHRGSPYTASNFFYG